MQNFVYHFGRLSGNSSARSVKMLILQVKCDQNLSTTKGWWKGGHVECQCIDAVEWPENGNSENNINRLKEGLAYALSYCYLTPEVDVSRHQ